VGVAEDNFIAEELAAVVASETQDRTCLVAVVQIRRFVATKEDMAVSVGGRVPGSGWFVTCDSDDNNVAKESD
jgi:hypothetical protein